MMVLFRSRLSLWVHFFFVMGGERNAAYGHKAECSVLLRLNYWKNPRKR